MSAVKMTLRAKLVAGMLVAALVPILVLALAASTVVKDRVLELGQAKAAIKTQKLHFLLLVEPSL